jgi:hypothetical protein
MKKDKGKKEIKVEEISFDIEEIRRETFQSNGGIDFNDPVIQENMTSITIKLTEKVKHIEKHTRQESATMNNILISSVRIVMKESMEKAKVHKQQVKKIKNTLRQIETRGARRHKIHGILTTMVTLEKVTKTWSEAEFITKMTS